MTRETVRPARRPRRREQLYHEPRAPAPGSIGPLRAARERGDVGDGTLVERAVDGVRVLPVSRDVQADQHLQSPVHHKSDCRITFVILSGLCQHIEDGSLWREDVQTSPGRNG
jgi:hypothetical protein